MPLLAPEYYLTVFLVFVRIGGLMVAAPFFGQMTVPIRVKIFFSVVLAYSVVGFVAAPLPPTVFAPIGLMVAVMIEALTGIVIGFAAQFVFWGVHYAAELIGFQMGLSMAQVFNPMNGLNSNPMGTFLGMTFLMVFILLDGPHHLLQALVFSFEVIPPAGARLAEAGPLLLDWTGGLFTTALRLASPFMVTFFLVETALGVFARVVPQADLFSLSLPIKLFVGFGIAGFFFRNLFPIIPGLIDHMNEDLYRLLEVLVP